MKSTEFLEKLKSVVTNYKTLYVLGCFGAPMNAKNKARYSSNQKYNKKASRKKKINAASDDTFGFDCVCLIKSILWGWCGNKTKTYGGASYCSNGVPDIGADQMITKCSGVSTTGWADMVPGEAVWMKGHIGVYIGDGLAIECTPKWKDGVQITAVHNIGKKSGYNGRKWTKHGKLPYIEYVENATPAKPTNTNTGSKLTVDGKWGKATTKRLQQIFGTTVDGIVSNQWACYKVGNPGLCAGFDWDSRPNGKGSQLIKAMQKWAGMPASEQDGEIGPTTIKAFQAKLGTTVDGKVSYPSDMVKALQKWANNQ